MKSILKNCFTFLTLLRLKIRGVKFLINKSVLFLSKFSIEKSNNLQIINGKVEKSTIHIQGKNNQLLIFGEVHNSDIKVWGNNNQIIISPKVTLNKSIIVLRGSNCKIEIGERTTFGGIYMVCMGEYNFIKIGKECMFAEKIDLWATDSHPIYDDKNELINPSKPVIIGDKVWIGAKSAILKGVNIGDGAVIGMSSIVTKDVVPFSLNVGNPLRCLKVNINWKREFIQV